MTQNKSPLPKEIRVQDNNIEPDKELPKVVQKPIKKEELFDFPTAIKMVTEGKKISREEWKNPNIYGVIKNEKLILHKEDKDHGWIISTGDLTNKDWFVV